MREEVERILNLYPASEEPVIESRIAVPELQLTRQTWTMHIELPYWGEIKASTGTKVEPDDVVAVNMYNPPRLYIVDGFARYTDMSADQIKASLLVRVGGTLDFDQPYAQIPPTVELPHHLNKIRRLESPVRGTVEVIDPSTGILVLSEIQDYSTKPVQVDVAQRLSIPPKRLERYLTKHLGDFIFRNDLLARRIEHSSDSAMPAFVRAPNTGTITAIDREKGTVTIAYRLNPLEFRAHVAGEVVQVTEGQRLEIRYAGTRLEGKLGFGKECHGPLALFQNRDEMDTIDLEGRIAVIGWSPDKEDLARLQTAKISGLVCFAIDSHTLIHWLGFEPGVINTGNEQIPFAIMVVGGFGSQGLPAGLLGKLNGFRSCYLNPHTRIRAGVVRPFVCLT
jgi:hypothetical protein